MINLKHGTTTIEEVCGVRTTHKTNPSFMLTLGSDSFSETGGEVIADALEWSGNYRIDFTQDETGTLQVNAAIFTTGSVLRSCTMPQQIMLPSSPGW